MHRRRYRSALPKLFRTANRGPNWPGNAGGSPTVDFSNETFAVTSGIGSRIYLGTRSTNYASVDFVFEATALMPETGQPLERRFFWLGTSSPEGEVREPVAPNVLAVIRLDDETANGLETRDSENVNSHRPSAGIEFTPKLSGKTVRLRMTWNAGTQQAFFDFDTDWNGGPFHSTHQLTVDGSDNGFRPWNAQLICGGGGGLQFDDICVTVTTAATAPATNR